MTELDHITEQVLKQIDGDGFRQKGAYNLRQNGISLCHGDSEHIKIKRKEDKQGIDVYMGENAKLYVMEKLMTHDKQVAESNMEVQMNGAGSSAQIISRSVAKGESRQIFHPKAVGSAKCSAHVQCDSIIMDQAEVSSIPEINAKHLDAAIIHEAAIGRINDEQLMKLRTLGMTAEEAESVIIENFLGES